MSDPELDPEERRFLLDLRRSLARLHHDLNNPLAVASGNLQLLRELVLSGVQDGLSEAVVDANEAVEELARRVERITALRDRLDARLGED